MEETTKPDINETVRDFSRAILSSMGWIVLLIVVGVVAYRYLIPDSTRNFETPEALVLSYTDRFRTFAPPTSVRPNNQDVSEFLGYFDNDSRRFIRSNARELAALHDNLNYRDHRDQIRGMSRRESRQKAMQYLISLAPLNGFASLRNQRMTEDGKSSEIQVRGTRGGNFTIKLVYEDNGWRISELAGLQETLDRRIRERVGAP